MAAERRHLAVLAGLAVALAALTWWQLRDRPAEPASAVEPDAATAQQQRSDADAARAASRVPRVELALLALEPAEPIDTGRDPFRFGSRRRATGPGPSGETEPGLDRPPVWPVPTGPPAPPPLPPIPLKFIGLVQQQGEQVRIAVLSDGRGIYHGREGDVIEGRYRILRIGDDSVEMTYLDGRGRQVIRLSGA